LVLENQRDGEGVLGQPIYKVASTDGVPSALFIFRRKIKRKI